MLEESRHVKAEAGVDKLKELRKSAKDDGQHVYTFDLQQALPMSKLNTGPIFYSRKWWKYNISIRD